MRLIKSVQKGRRNESGTNGDQSAKEKKQKQHNERWGNNENEKKSTRVK